MFEPELPAVPESDMAEPDMAEPDMAEPDMAEPEATEVVTDAAAVRRTHVECCLPLSHSRGSPKRASLAPNQVAARHLLHIILEACLHRDAGLCKPKTRHVYYGPGSVCCHAQSFPIAGAIPNWLCLEQAAFERLARATLPGHMAVVHAGLLAGQLSQVLAS